MTTQPAQPAGDWEQQAAVATQKAAALEQKVSDLETELTKAKQNLTATERRHVIQRELAAAGAVDTDVGALLTEGLIAAQPKPDIKAAIAELRRSKPYLFRPHERTSAMSQSTGPAPTNLEEAAHTARQSGDRRALLSYLRLRRQQ